MDVLQKLNDFNNVISKKFREVELKEMCLYPNENSTEDEFDESYNFFKKAFIFNISEKKYGSVFDYFAFMKYLEEHITSEKESFVGEYFYLDNNKILEITMEKDSEDKLFFKFVLFL